MDTKHLVTSFVSILAERNTTSVPKYMKTTIENLLLYCLDSNGCYFHQDTLLFPLLHATMFLNEHVVRHLVEVRTNIFQCLPDPWYTETTTPTALHAACLDGNLKVIRILLSNFDIEADVECPPECAHNGNCKTVATDSSCEAKQNMDTLFSRTQSWFSGLYTKLWPNKNEVCETFVSQAKRKSAKRLEITNYQGHTPLHLAIQSGNLDLIEFLLELGCDPNLLDNIDNSCVHVALQNHTDKKACKILKVLVKYGCKREIHNTRGQSVSDIAISKEYKRCLKFLCAVKYTRSINITDESDTEVENEINNNPSNVVHYHSNLTYSHNTSALFGPDFHAKAYQHHIVKEYTYNDVSFMCFTSLHVAAQYGDTTCLRTLLKLDEHRLCINNYNNQGFTPVFLAVYHDNDQALQILLNQDADASLPSSRGVFPLKVALLRGKVDTLRLLLRHGAHLGYVSRIMIQPKNADTRNEKFSTPISSKPHKIIDLNALFVQSLFLSNSQAAAILIQTGLQPAINLNTVKSHLTVLMPIIPLMKAAGVRTLLKTIQTFLESDASQTEIQFVNLSGRNQCRSFSDIINEIKYYFKEPKSLMYCCRLVVRCSLELRVLKDRHQLDLPVVLSDYISLDPRKSFGRKL